MWIHLFSQDGQFLVGRRRRCGKRLVDTEFEAGCPPALLQRDAGVPAEYLHPLRDMVVAHHRQIGDNPVWSSSGGQTGSFSCSWAGEVTGRREEIQLFHESPFVMI